MFETRPYRAHLQMGFCHCSQHTRYTAVGYDIWAGHGLEYRSISTRGFPSFRWAHQQRMTQINKQPFAAFILAYETYTAQSTHRNHLNSFFKTCETTINALAQIVTFRLRESEWQNAMTANSNCHFVLPFRKLMNSSFGMKLQTKQMKKIRCQLSSCNFRRCEAVRETGQTGRVIISIKNEIEMDRLARVCSPLVH